MKNDKWLRQDTQILSVSQRRETIHHKNQQAGDLYLETYWEAWGKTRWSWKDPSEYRQDLQLWMGGGRPQKTNPNPPQLWFRKYIRFHRRAIQILQENGALQIRWVFHREKSWLSNEKAERCFLSSTLKHRCSTGEAAERETLKREGGNTNSFHLIQLEIPSESMTQTWNPSSLHGGTPREFEEHINRAMEAEEIAESCKGSEEHTDRQPLRVRGSGNRQQDPHLSSNQLERILFLLRSNSKFKHSKNVNSAWKSAKTLTEAKYYAIVLKTGLYIILPYSHKIANCCYISFIYLNNLNLTIN